MSDSSEEQDKRGPKEIAYDSEIASLVLQIEKICDKHSIPFVMSFGLDGELGCSLGNIDRPRSPKGILIRMFSLVYGAVRNGRNG